MAWIARRAVALFIAINLGVFAPTIWAQTSNSDTSAIVEREVLEAQIRLFQAIMDVDIDALDAALSSEFTYTHSPGYTETKGEFLSSLRTQSKIYKSIEPADINVRIYSNVAVVTGISTLKLIVRERPVEVSVRFIRVFHESGGNWRLVAWQSTELPGE